MGTMALTERVWPGTHFVPLPDDNYVVVVIPAEMAARIIAALAAGVVSGVLVYLVLARIAAARQAGTPDSLAQDSPDGA